MRLRGYLKVATAELLFLVHLHAASSFRQHFQTTSMSMSTSTPVVLPAKVPLPEVFDGITVVSFNVLLPNGNDGWWMFKVRTQLEVHTSKYQYVCGQGGGDSTRTG